MEPYYSTGWSISYRKYILQITQPSQYRYAKLQYRFAVISGSPSRNHGETILMVLLATNLGCFLTFLYKYYNELYLFSIKSTLMNCI